MGERWTEEAVLRESERWVHVPQDGKCIEDERRLLVRLPKRCGTSRVWRSWAADEERASDLIEETVGEVRAAGGGRILWHTGDRVAPPFMDECLARHGFRTTEKLEVLAFSLVDGQEQRLPWISVPEDISVEVTHTYDTGQATGSGCCDVTVGATGVVEVPLASAFIRGRKPAEKGAL